VTFSSIKLELNSTMSKQAAARHKRGGGINREGCALEVLSAVILVRLCPDGGGGNIAMIKTWLKRKPLLSDTFEHTPLPRTS